MKYIPQRLIAGIIIAILASIVFLISGKCNAQTVADLDERNGYKNIQLGMSKDSLLNIYKAKTESTDTISQTILITDKSVLKFGDFVLQEVEVHNYQKENRIYMIMLKFDGKLMNYSFKELINFFTMMYGEPQSIDNRNAQWKGVKVRLTVKYNYYPEILLVFIQDIELAGKVDAQIREQQRQKGKEF